MKRKLALIAAMAAVFTIAASSCGTVESADEKVDINISRNESTEETSTEAVTEAVTNIAEDPVTAAKNRLREKGIGIEFKGEVENDTTGKWRLAETATTVDVPEYAVDYYHAYFKADDEIHAIVNKKSNTTTCITKSDDSDKLYVTVHEYVEGEENDALKLFSGPVVLEEIIGLDGAVISSDTFEEKITVVTTAETTSGSTANNNSNNNNSVNNSNSNSNNNSSNNDTPSDNSSDPVEEQPTEASPVEEQPTEAPPVEEQPTEAAPVEEQPTEAPPVEEQPDYTFSLNDLNSDPADMISSLPQPNDIQEASACLPNGGDDKVYAYDGLTVYCFVLGGQETVYGIYITDSKWNVLGGIKVGSTRADVEAAYGAGEDDNGKLVYKMGDSTLTFSFSDDTVTVIDFSMPV